MKYYLVVCILLIMNTGCIGDRHKPVTYQATDTSVIFQNDTLIDLRSFSVKEYINLIQNSTINQQHINIAIMPADTGWVKKNDIPFLMTLLTSTKSTPCIMNIVSSELRSDKSTLGGHAMRLIDSYRLHTHFPAKLTECPETDSSEIAIIKKWWVSQHH